MPVADLWCMHCGELVGKLVTDHAGALRVCAKDGAVSTWSTWRRPRCARCSGPVYADETAYALPQMVDPLPGDVRLRGVLAV